MYQCTSADSQGALILLVPANCTDCLQPLDISMNQSVKHFLHEQFQEWYADQFCHQLQNGSRTPEVDLNLSIMKPLEAIWLIKLIDYLKLNHQLAVNGFHKVEFTMDFNITYVSVYVATYCTHVYAELKVQFEHTLCEYLQFLMRMMPQNLIIVHPYSGALVQLSVGSHMAIPQLESCFIRPVVVCMCNIPGIF